MENKYICPLCHSTDIKQEEDYKVALNKLLNVICKNDDIKLCSEIEALKKYNPYDDELYLKHLEKHGFRLTCNNCGNIFYELDKKEPFHEPTKITKEEFLEIIFEAIDDVFPDKEQARVVKFFAEKSLCSTIKTFYKEFAVKQAEKYYSINEEIKDNMIDKFED